MTIIYHALPGEFQALKEGKQQHINLRNPYPVEPKADLIVFEISLPVAVVKNGEQIISQGKRSQVTGKQFNATITTILTTGLMANWYSVGFNIVTA